jgi:hypothetical protein
VKDGAETDVDCGGAACVALGKTCPYGGKCGVDADCYTGHCNAGVCGPLTLASAQQFPMGLTTDSSNVYWVNYMGGNVMKVPKTGGTPVQIATTITPDPRAITIDSVNVYWVTDYLNGGTGDVWKAPIGGGTAGTRLATGQGYLQGIAVDTANVYYSDSNGTVRKVPIAGGTPTALATGVSSPFGVAVDFYNVYWTSTTGIYKQSLTAPFATTMIQPVMTGSTPFSLTIDTLRAYWGDNGGYGVMQGSLSGGGAVTLKSPAGSVAGIAVDTSNVYWAGDSTNTIAKTPIGGGTVTVLSNVLGTQPWGIAVDGTNVYYTNTGTGTVQAMHK